MDKVIYNNQMMVRSEVRIHPDDRGFRYGDGVFETIRVANSTPYQLEWHLSRLARGLSAIFIDYDVLPLVDACHTLIASNKLNEGLLRIQITRGVGGRGYLPDAHAVPTLFIETLSLPPAPAAPVKLWLSSYRKVSDKALPVQAKLSQGLNSTLARLEADRQGCFDAILLNEHGEICETSSANIFWHHEGIWYTPALDCGVLEGSTRAALINQLGNNAQEAPLTLDILTKAEAVAICNAGIGIVAVSELLPNGKSWHRFELVTELLELWQQDITLHTGSTE